MYELLAVMLTSLVTYIATSYNYWKKKKLTDEQVEKILLDLLRHYSRNEIVLHAIQEKMLSGQIEKPSRAHFLRLKSLEGDSILNVENMSFYSRSIIPMYHRYLLNVRNFDVTAELAAEYLSSPDYDKDFFMQKHLTDSIERQHILSYKVEEMLFTLFPEKYSGETGKAIISSYILNKAGRDESRDFYEYLGIHDKMLEFVETEKGKIYEEEAVKQN